MVFQRNQTFSKIQMFKDGSIPMEFHLIKSLVLKVKETEYVLQIFYFFSNIVYENSLKICTKPC